MSSKISVKTKLLNDETKVNTSYNSVISDLKKLHENNEKSDNIPFRKSLSRLHCHTLNPVDDGIDKTAQRKLIVAIILCSSFMFVEIIGGYLANSLAIATDAAHLLTDLAGFLISLFSLHIATRPASFGMSFGWHRAEVIGALTSVLLIWIITGILCYMAVQRLINKEYEIEAGIMVTTATIGVVVNLIMGIQLQIGGNSNQTNDSDIEKQKKGENINIRAAVIHIVGDFCQSVGVLVAALIIYFIPEWGFIDPICTFLFSIIVLIVTFNIIKDVLNVLMEGKPSEVDFLNVQQTLNDIPGVIKVHNLRIWSLSLDKTALSAHLAIDNGENPTIILNMASQLINNKFSIYDLTLQVEEYKDEMSICLKCVGPIS